MAIDKQRVAQITQELADIIIGEAEKVNTQCELMGLTIEGSASSPYSDCMIIASRTLFEDGWFERELAKAIQLRLSQR